MDGTKPQPMKSIYDNVHRIYTQWPVPLMTIINTPEFQRLKRIKQLGACHHVFTGAVHTRFEHSIGVGHLAQRMMHTLRQNQPELGINDDTVLIFQLAGLCHDVGHGPISHGFDQFLAQLFGNKLPWVVHEERSVQMLQYIVRTHNIPLTTHVIEAACELIYPFKHDLPSWWYQIIANDDDCIDVDKFDYLLRDCFMTGVSCNDIDINRFLDYARVCKAAGTNNTRLCYPKKLQFDVSQLFLTRHRLHAQVYQHPTVRAFEMMYTDILQLLSPSLKRCIERCDDISWLTQWTDDIFTPFHIALQRCKETMTDKQHNAALSLLRRIDTRQHYRFVGEHKVNALTPTHTSKQKDWLIKHLAPSAARLDEEQCRADEVHIGYDTHPFYKVYFYSKNRPNCAERMKTDDTSAIVPVHTKDVYWRLYTTASVI